MFLDVYDKLPNEPKRSVRRFQVRSSRVKVCETNPTSHPPNHLSAIPALSVVQPAKSEGIRLNSTFEMFLRNEAKLCRPYMARYILVAPPRASLCCALGYHITVLSGLVGWCENYQAKPSLGAQFKVSGSKFKVFRNYETNPFIQIADKTATV
jgi:hypothetical protein